MVRFEKVNGHGGHGHGGHGHGGHGREIIFLKHCIALQFWPTDTICVCRLDLYSCKLIADSSGIMP